MRSIKEDLALLEYNITKLKVEYEQYFIRVLKREPLALRGQIDKNDLLLHQPVYSKYLR